MFSIDTDFSLNDYLISKGIPTSISSMSSVLADQLLDHLGVSKFFSDTPCNRSSFAGTLSGFEIGTLFKLKYLICRLFPLVYKHVFHKFSLHIVKQISNKSCTGNQRKLAFQIEVIDYSCCLTMYMYQLVSKDILFSFQMR